MIIRNFVSNSPVEPVDPVFPDPPPKLYQGVDTVRGETRNSIVKGGYTVSDSSASQLLKVSVDYQSLAESTEINQSASVGVGLFGGSEKISFVKEVERTSWSINMTIRSSYRIGVAEARDYRLDLTGFDFRDPASRREFFNQYGDSWVSTVALGSEYLGVFTFHLNSESEHKSVMTSLEAHGLLSAFSFNADLQTKMSSFFANTKMRATLSQTTFGLGKVALPTFENMIEFARTLPEKQVVSPAILRTTVSGYESLLPEGSFAAVVNNRDYFVGSDFKLGVYADRAAINDQIKQLDSIHAIHDTYGYDEPALVDAKKAATEDLAKLDAQVRHYRENPEHDFTAEKPALPSVKKGRPGVAFESNFSPAWGGTGGGPFDDVGSVTEFVSSQKHIHSLRMHSGDYVRCLTVKYKGASGEAETEQKHGKEEDTRGQELFLENGDVISKLGGCSGAYVDELKIELRPSGKNISAGKHNDNLGKIDWSPEKDQTVIGFRGYSGANLDQIQAVWVRFKPTTWKAPF